MKHPLTHLGCEVFHFVHLRWCVTRAHELLEVHESVAEFHEHAPLARLDNFLPLTSAADGFVKLVEFDVDVEYAMTKTDLSKPIIVVPLSVRGKPAGAIPIDGWHRIYRALRDERESLPAYLLNSTAEEAIRIPR